MYLEISGRRTGKTTRMLKAIDKAYEEGKHIAIFSRNKYEENNIIKHIREEELDGIKIFRSKKDFQEQLLGKSLSMNDFKVFYDEFDYIRNQKDIIISDDGYYVTTPAKIRSKQYWGDNIEDDILLKLLDMNAGSYVKIVNKELVEDFKHSYKYTQEIKGEFV